jgi:RNA polymerase sigma factor (sigma-70 family)
MDLNIGDIRMLVYVVTKRTGTPLRDEDLEQEIAVKALEASRRLGHVAYPRALLMKIVNDAVRDHWRRRRPPEALEKIDARLLSHSPAFELELDQRRRIELLRTALDRLPRSKRALLDLFYTHGHSIPEIAAIEGKSISAVKMELSRSRRTLARLVNSLEAATKNSPFLRKCATF